MLANILLGKLDFSMLDLSFDLKFTIGVSAMASDLSLLDLESLKNHVSAVTVLSVPSMPLILQFLFIFCLNNSFTPLFSILFSLLLHSLKFSSCFFLLLSLSICFFLLSSDSLSFGLLFSFYP